MNKGIKEAGIKRTIIPNIQPVLQGESKVLVNYEVLIFDLIYAKF